MSKIENIGELPTNNNRYQGQLKGPFIANEEIMDLIRAAAAVEVDYVWHLGVQTDVRAMIKINGQEIEIGKTGMYEIGNTEITSIVFIENTDENSIIDYVIKQPEKDIIQI